MSPFMNWPVNNWKKYMEWSANYFDTIQPGDTEYRYNAERKKSKYVTYRPFSVGE